MDIVRKVMPFIVHVPKHGPVLQVVDVAVIKTVIGTCSVALAYQKNNF